MKDLLRPLLQQFFSPFWNQNLEHLCALIDFYMYPGPPSSCEQRVLSAPFRKAHSPKAAAYQSPVLGRVRYLIDTVFGQLTDRCQMKRVWARDLWHLRNRLLRYILMHTICFFFNQQDKAPLLQFDRLVA
jgi:hypothetical protein